MWDCPTVVNNVETIAAVVPIINEGGDEYAKIGIGKSTGTKLISACGNINKPGVYEIDMTISVEEFIYSDEWCGGIKDGKKLKALYYNPESSKALWNLAFAHTMNGECDMGKSYMEKYKLATKKKYWDEEQIRLLFERCSI